MSTTTVLVTGANRGIGKGLVTQLLSRPNHTVIGSVRDTSSASSKELDSLAKANGSSLILVQFGSTSESEVHAAAKALQTEHKIDHIDTIIANAGIAKYFGPAAETPISEVRDHYEVNVIGPLILFQAFVALLQKSKSPRFVTVTSGLASIGDQDKYPMQVAAYGASKAALNYVTRKIHYENEWLIAFPINPGWVQTDMGNAGAKANGMEEAPVKVEDSASGILNTVDGATREATGGSFADFADTKWAW